MRAALENPAHSDPFTRGLLVEMLEKAYGARAVTRTPTPLARPGRYSAAWLEPRIRTLVDRWKAADRRVLVYGAGQHTANLLKWTPLTEAQLVGLADGNRALHGRVYWGLKVVAPDRIADLKPDVVLISSESYQDEIYSALKPLEAEGVELVRLYGEAA